MDEGYPPNDTASHHAHVNTVVRCTTMEAKQSGARTQDLEYQALERLHRSFALMFHMANWTKSPSDLMRWLRLTPCAHCAQRPRRSSESGSMSASHPPDFSIGSYIFIKSQGLSRTTRIPSTSPTSLNAASAHLSTQTETPPKTFDPYFEYSIATSGANIGL